MLGVNKVILIGNLGRDPELRRISNGNSVASFPIATTERWNDKNGERQERTEWHNIVVWGKLADLANQYLKKGQPVYIEGKITTNSWEDKDGIKRYKTEISANQMQFLGKGGTDNVDSTPSSAPEAEIEEVKEDVVAQDSVVEDNLPF